MSGHKGMCMWKFGFVLLVLSLTGCGPKMSGAQCWVNADGSLSGHSYSKYLHCEVKDDGSVIAAWQQP